MNNIDFKKIFYDWSHYLNALLVSDYMKMLMAFINESYKSKHILPINKKLIFKPFSKVSIYDVKVIIIGNEPYHNKGINVGIPFAQKDTIADLETSLQNIEDCIERTQYDCFKLNINTELNHWTDQKVLPLYSALTTELNKKNAHIKHWRNFIRNVILAVNENRNGIIFMLWGEEAQYFKDIIDVKKHYVLESSSPDSVDKNWDCSNFSECNSIIKENNGEEYCIKW